MSKPKRFVLNDETVYNCYGFRVQNDGIDLTRFNANPVMLDGHWNSNDSVIGKWDKLSIDGATLTADAIFDMEDERAANIAGKVERGFINGCSMGLLFSPANMVLEPNGKWLLAKSELIEDSIIPVPANSNAIRLYIDKDGKLELMKEDEVKVCLSALTTETKIENKNSENMKKVFLSVAALVALGLDKNYNPADGVDSTQVDDAINGLKSKLDQAALKLSAAETALKKYTDAETEKLNAEVKEFVDSVIPSKYDETERDTVTKLAQSDLPFAKRVAAAIPVKTNLTAVVKNTADAKPGDIKTMEDFQKLDVPAQLAFKANNKAAYDKLVAEM